MVRRITILGMYMVVGSLAAQCLCMYAVGTKLQLTTRKLITLRHEMLVQSLCNSLASCDPPSLARHPLPSVLMAITQSLHDCATAVTWRIRAGSSPASCDPPIAVYPDKRLIGGSQLAGLHV